MDPDENLVRPEVEINIEANASDFPNLGSDFYIGSPGATSPLHCEGQNYGTWPVPNDPTQYELTFDVELAGYPALKGIKLDFSSSYESVHTVYLDGQVDENGEIIQGNIPFFTITFYDDGAYQINFLSQYRPALGQSTPPITGDLKLTINATDPVNDNTSSLSTERELMFRDSQLNLGAIKADTPANEEDLRGLGAGDPLPEITLYDSSQTSNRLYGWKILTSKAEASAAGADLEITDWTRSADTTPEGYEIWTLDLGADAHGTLTMYRYPSGTQG